MNTSVNLDSVLSRHNEQEAAAQNPPPMQLKMPPAVGLLSQTVIPSPAVNFIFAARIRSQQHNDVAFVGADFVQVRQMKSRRSDGHLRDIARKEGFGSRIRNACVVGTAKPFDPPVPRGSIIPMDESESEAEDEAMHNTSQGLILALESGHLVLLVLEGNSTTHRFICGRQTMSLGLADLQPGTHLATEPQSRYLAVGCSATFFTVYRLRERSTWKQETLPGSLSFIEAETRIQISGVIVKMDFLYPQKDDRDHVILLLIVARKGQSRLVIYEWVAGADLATIKQHGNEGLLLSEDYQMPLLLMPLRFETAFILVFEHFMAGFRRILEGPPVIEEFSFDCPPPTPYHHGRGVPLWVAWSRPYRVTAENLENRDDLYIAREDGVIKFLELNREDFAEGDSIVAQSTCNIGSAFTTVDLFHKASYGDLVIASGGAGVGGTYLLMARQGPKMIETIQNWSPARDFALVSDFHADFTMENNMVTRKGPDRLFTCMGRGIQSTITELRYGIEAKIGLESIFNTLIMDAWVVSPKESTRQDESLLLLSLPHRSALLRLLLSPRLKEGTEGLDEVGEESTAFDLANRTIMATWCGNITLQVTERSISFIENNVILKQYRGDDLVLDGQFISTAVVFQGYVLFSTYTGLDAYSLRMVKMRNSSSSRDFSALQALTTVKRPVTALASGMIRGRPHACVAFGSLLSVFPLESLELDIDQDQMGIDDCLDIASLAVDKGTQIDDIVSMTVLTTTPTGSLVICGTNNGIVVTLTVAQTSKCSILYIERIGASTVKLTVDDVFNTRIYAICDSRMFTLTPSSFSTPANPRMSIHRIWLTESHTPALAQHEVNAVARLGTNLSAGTVGGLLVISGTHLLLVVLNGNAKAVPRHLAIRGSPSRMIYSHHLGAFIVSALVNDSLTLLFIDPETGFDLSMPVDHNNAPVGFISGLGKEYDHAYALCEWSYTKDSKDFHFVILCTKASRLLIISAEKTQELAFKLLRPATMEQLGPRPPTPPTRIRCWTRHNIKSNEPIYSVLGNQQGLIYSAGKILKYDCLVDKKFKTVAQHELLSPAHSLSMRDGTIFVLTQLHSLQLFKLFTDATDGWKFELTHSDQLTRCASHSLDAGPIQLVSTKSKTIAGLWPSQHAKADTLDTLFEGELPYSILRMRAGFPRPLWDSCYLNMHSSRDESLARTHEVQPDILGMGLDGSVSHLTLLDQKQWRLLKFICNMAQQSPRICEFAYDISVLPIEPATSPKSNMHVDGDILRRCLERRELENLLCVGQDTDHAHKVQAIFLDALLEVSDGIRNVDGFDTAIQLAYDILERILRPVM